MQLGDIGSAVNGLDADADILGITLGIFDEHIEVAVFIKRTRVQQLEFGIRAAAATILVNQTRVGIMLRILVQHPHVAVGRCVIQVEPVLLDIFSVVAFGTSEAEHALFQDRIATVPQREREDQELVAVADAGDAILTPAICLAPGHVMSEEIPGRAIRAVIFAHRAPGPLADIWSPLAPRRNMLDKRLG